MTLTPVQQAEAARCLAAVRLVKFDASSTQIKGGQSATVSWVVDTSHCPPPYTPRITFDAGVVAVTGSVTVRPAANDAFILSANVLDQWRTLGTIDIAVDTSACQALAIQASVITPQIVTGIQQNIDAYNAGLPNTDYDLRILSDVVTIDPRGIVIPLRLRLNLPDYFDPFIDVDAVVDVDVLADGTLVAFYKSFSVNVGWKWYVGLVPPFITAIVDHIISDEVSGQIKQAILDGFDAELKTALDTSAAVITAVAPAQDKLIVTVCFAS